MRMFENKNLNHSENLKKDNNIFLSDKERVELRLKENGLLKGHKKKNKKNNKKKRKGRK